MYASACCHSSAHCYSFLQLRDQARRFITLVDELYNSQCQLICSADCPPDALFAGSLGEQPIIDLEQLQYEGAVEGEQQSVRAGRSLLLLSCSCVSLLQCFCSLRIGVCCAGSRLRRNLMVDGGVAPVAATADAAAAASAQLGGAEEQFAFARAVSRLHEMQSEKFLQLRAR